jgi:two-component system response regulator YesN
MPDKILVVDDDAEFRSELKDYLEDYEILEASDGREALRLLSRANEIGVVILDVNMPGLSGTDCLKEIKRTDPNLGIIILTGHSSKDVAIEALKGHADDYIEKPLDIPNIKQAIEKLLEKREGETDIVATDIKAKIEKVKRFIERNCYKKITLNDAASSICLSPKYLSRVFKQHTKRGFNDYKLSLKINKAKGLLEKTGYNINQISDKLGYENAESFIRQFKNHTKCTPTEYRKKALKMRKRG